MMTILVLMSILCIKFAAGMDSDSNTPESSNEDPIYFEYSNNNVDNHKTINNEYKPEKYEKNEKFDTIENSNNLSDSEINLNQSNKLKRKHQSDKFCEFCGQSSSTGRLTTSKVSNTALCHACYKYERQHGKLIPPNERQQSKHKNHVCEFCQQESIRYYKGKVSGKSLCMACYDCERKYDYLIPLDERKKHEHHKNHILVCEFCQQESKRYKKGKVSGKSLCQSCYHYEYQYGRLIPLDKRKKLGKHKNHIIVCEFCQQESIRYYKGKASGKSLCMACYRYENQHGILIPLDERKKRKKLGKHKDILACAVCQRNSTKYKTGKFSGKILCNTCYNHEFRCGYLDEQNKDYRKNKDSRNDQMNSLTTEKKSRK